MEANIYLFANGIEIHKFKVKDSEIAATSLFLGNISRERSVDNMKKMDFTVMFIFLVSIMMLLQLMIF